MRGEQQELCGEIRDVLVQPGAVLGLAPQTNDGRCPRHELIEHIVLLPLVAGFQRYGEAKCRHLLNVEPQDLRDLSAGMCAVEAHRAGAAKALRRPTDPENRLEPEAEPPDLDAL